MRKGFWEVSIAVGLWLFPSALAQGSEPSSIIDAINQSLRQAVQQSAKSVEPQKPSAPLATPKPVQLLPSDWLAQMSRDYTLTSEANQPLPRQRIQWFLQHKGLLQAQLQSMRSQIFSLTQQLKAKGLPTELGLAPLLVARGGVAWNEQSLVMLVKLKASQSEPLFLIAAFSAGGPAVSALRRAHPNTAFWALPWPERTVSYVANIVALAQLVKQAEAYGLVPGGVEPPVPTQLRPLPLKPLPPSQSAPTLPLIIEQVFPKK